MLTDLYNAIMQLIFIITGLVSVKTMVGLITELVGQGDALKDGEETSKEVKKRVAQTAGAAAMGVGATAKVAGMGLKAAGGAAKAVAGKAAGTETGQAAIGAVRGVASKVKSSKVGSAVGSAVSAVNIPKKVRTVKELRDLEKNNPIAYGMMQLNAVADPTGEDAQKLNLYNSKRGKALLMGAKAGGAVKNSTKSAVKGVYHSAVDKEGTLNQMWNATGDFRKQIAGMTGFAGQYEEIAKEAGFDDNKYVEGVGKRLFGYKSGKTKGQDQLDREATAFAKKQVAVTHGYDDYKEAEEKLGRKPGLKVEADKNAVFNVTDTNINAATVDMKAASSKTSTGSSTIASTVSSLADKAINATIANPVDVKGSVGLSDSSISALKESNNQTAQSINSRLLAVIAGLEYVGDTISRTNRDTNRILEKIDSNTQKKNKTK